MGQPYTHTSFSTVNTSLPIIAKTFKQFPIAFLRSKYSLYTHDFTGYIPNKSPAGPKQSF